jgi:hypothetical protein
MWFGRVRDSRRQQGPFGNHQPQRAAVESVGLVPRERGPQRLLPKARRFRSENNYRRSLLLPTARRGSRLPVPQHFSHWICSGGSPLLGYFAHQPIPPHSGHRNGSGSSVRSWSPGIINPFPVYPPLAMKRRDVGCLLVAARNLWQTATTLPNFGRKLVRTITAAV